MEYSPIRSIFRKGTPFLIASDCLLYVNCSPAFNRKGVSRDFFRVLSPNSEALNEINDSAIPFDQTTLPTLYIYQIVYHSYSVWTIQYVDYPMAQAYAAGLVVQRCIEEASNADNDALRDAAAKLRFSTFYGNYQIDESGRQVGRETMLVQWQDGQKNIVWPRRSAQVELAYPWR